jgi:hypothetical protein
MLAAASKGGPKAAMRAEEREKKKGRKTGKKKDLALGRASEDETAQEVPAKRKKAFIRSPHECGEESE